MKCGGERMKVRELIELMRTDKTIEFRENDKRLAIVDSDSKGMELFNNRTIIDWYVIYGGSGDICINLESEVSDDARGSNYAARKFTGILL